MAGGNRECLAGNVTATATATTKTLALAQVESCPVEARMRKSNMIKLEQQVRPNSMRSIVNDSNPNVLSQDAGKMQPTTATIAAVELAKTTPDHGGQTSGADQLPKFETGAIAFMPVPSGKLWAYRVSVHFGKHYASRNGRTFPVNPAELLTGFEPDFPGFEAIDWGGFKPRTMTPEECLLEDEANNAEILQRESQEAWEDEQYSDLLAKYEQREAARPKANPEDLLELPLFQLTA